MQLGEGHVRRKALRHLAEPMMWISADVNYGCNPAGFVARLQSTVCWSTPPKLNLNKNRICWFEDMHYMQHCSGAPHPLEAVPYLWHAVTREVHHLLYHSAWQPTQPDVPLSCERLTPQSQAISLIL